MVSFGLTTHTRPHGPVQPRVTRGYSIRLQASPANSLSFPFVRRPMFGTSRSRPPNSPRHARARPPPAAPRPLPPAAGPPRRPLILRNSRHGGRRRLHGRADPLAPLEEGRRKLPDPVR